MTKDLKFSTCECSQCGGDDWVVVAEYYDVFLVDHVDCQVVECVECGNTANIDND